MVDGIDIPLCDLKLAALRGADGCADMIPECVFIQCGSYPKEIGTWLPVIDDIGSSQLFSHVGFVTPGRYGELSQIRKL